MKKVYKSHLDDLFFFFESFELMRLQCSLHCKTSWQNILPPNIISDAQIAGIIHCVVAGWSCKKKKKKVMQWAILNILNVF